MNFGKCLMSSAIGYVEMSLIRFCVAYRRRKGSSSGVVRFCYNFLETEVTGQLKGLPNRSTIHLSLSLGRGTNRLALDYGKTNHIEEEKMAGQPCFHDETYVVLQR